MLNLSEQVVYPDGNNPKIYYGCINIDNQIFKIRFSNPCYLVKSSTDNNDNNNIICEMDGKLSQILFHCKTIIEERLFISQNPQQFVNEIYNILYKILNKNKQRGLMNISSSFYFKICKELDTINWKNVKQISCDMTQFVIKTKKKHELIFKIIDVNNFPKSIPIIITNQLPLKFEFKWNNHILNVLEQYEIQCKKYQTFWNIIDDFYKHSVVLEPEKKDYGNNVLRILLNENKKTTMEIKLNPLNCKNEKCQCNFYGIKEEINLFEQKWNNDNEYEWNDNILPRDNIEEILNIKFINNINNFEYYDNNECSMCLQYKDDENNQIPNITCKFCKQSFHKSCLLQWINSLNNNNNNKIKTSYTSINGKCPQCSSQISIDI